MSLEPEQTELVVREIPNTKNDNNEWKTCCGRTSDRRLLQFIASLSISILILIFSCYKLSQELGCTTENVYVGLITLIIGFWVKSPID